MSTLCVVPKCTPDSSPELKEAVEVTAAVITTLDHVLDRLKSEEVRTRVPLMVIQFIAANIAHDAVVMGFSEDDLQGVRARIRDGASEGFDEGRKAIEAKEREGYQDGGIRRMSIERNPRRPRRFTRGRA